MAYVITPLCVDCKDTACADVCPVECIYDYQGGDRATFPNQLYIHPDECIDCTNCEPACPWKAIFEEDVTPELFKASIDLNRSIVDSIGDFAVAKVVKGHAPTAEQVKANFEKHGYEP
jgi:ferredoxin